MPAFAAELVIVAGARGGEAAKAVTTTIPIVFLSGGDRVRTSLVASLNRSGGNLTGVSTLSLDMETKRLGLLRDLLPQASTIAILADPTSASMEFQVQQAQAAARSIGVSIRVVTAGNERDFEPAFATLAREAAGGLIVSNFGS